MSLINKMLQDLDARGTPAGQSFPGNVKPVAPESRMPSLRLLGAGAGVAAACVAGAVLGWSHFHAAQPVRGAAAPAPAKPVATKPAQMTVVPAAPAVVPAQAPVAQPGGPVRASADPMSAPPQMRVADDPARAHKVQHEDEAEPLRPAAARADAQRAREADADAEAAPATSSVAVKPKSVQPMEPDSVEAREARRAAAIELSTRGTRMARLAKLSAEGARGAGVKGKSSGKVEPEGMQESSAQRAENAYRRALASLQEGRMIEAVASLQQALRIDPGHDAARQTLVGLLVEAGRTDDAIHELQLGLSQDPRQPALAMLLARLQIEHGGSGIETLQRTLPYAGNDPEYHGFLAGALQRQQRHHEAIDQYQQALRAAPGNGVWWMGLGMSLQGDKRNAEALDAFQRARASGSLNADLQGFVERRIQLLSH